MTARVSQNLRSGYLHEELGLLLLRRVAVVAEVPRPDDVGIDAIATLLRPSVRTLQYADNATFCVQFKASSVEVVEYNINPKTKKMKDLGHIRWLTELPLPFFIASVDTCDSSIHLFSTQTVYKALATVHLPKAIRLVFDSRKAARGITCPSVYLGEPIAEWSLSSTGREGFTEQLYQITKAWVDFERGNISARKLGYVEIALYKTNEPPRDRTTHQLLGRLGEDPSRDTMDALRTPIRSFALELLSKGHCDEVDTVKRVIDLMRSKGVDPDPDGMIEFVESTIGPLVKNGHRSKGQQAE